MSTVSFAKKIFGSNIKGIESINYAFKWKYKIVVFVPLKNTDELTFSMASAGAGIIGKYTVCSFRTKGVGTFIGSKASSPVAGKKQKFEMIEEVRLEMICNEECLNEAIDNLYEVHPYEEPAYEIYPVMVRNRKPDNSIIAISFKKKAALINIIKRINNSLDDAHLKQFPAGTEILSAVIDFSKEPLIESAAKTKNKVLYITKNTGNSYNFRLV